MTAIFSLAQDVARLKAKANLPAELRELSRGRLRRPFSATDTTYSGYAATIDGGLRFAPDAIAENQLQLSDPYDPLVGPVGVNTSKVSGQGLLLPAYTMQIFRIVKGNAGTMSLDQYSYQTTGLVQATMSRQRMRYGAEFEEAAGSSFFSGGVLLPTPAQGYNAATFQKNGETFQIYDTGQANPDGQEVLRLANYWLDTVATPYWQRLTTVGGASGYPWCQTWVQNQSGWCLGICPKIAQKPTSGTLRVGICATVNGQPDLTNVLAQATLAAADVVVNASLGTWTVPIEPTYLAAGGRYGYFIISDAGYQVFVADISANAGGTCFYAVDGGVFYPNPSQNIMFDLAFASFKQSQVVVQLGSLSLPGGVAAIDILADTVVPSNTVLSYEIRLDGTATWIPLTESDGSALASLPPLVFLRARMTGTANLMPGHPPVGLPRPRVPAEDDAEARLDRRDAANALVEDLDQDDADRLPACPPRLHRQSAADRGHAARARHHHGRGDRRPHDRAHAGVQPAGRGRLLCGRARRHRGQRRQPVPRLLEVRVRRMSRIAVKPLPAGQTRGAAPAAVLEPTHKVAADTVFDPAHSYRVRLSGVATYLGSPLSPMHLHVVTGTVAQAIRTSIARFDSI